jgi:hypothetical protein
MIAHLVYIKKKLRAQKEKRIINKWQDPWVENLDQEIVGIGIYKDWTRRIKMTIRDYGEFVTIDQKYGVGVQEWGKAGENNFEDRDQRTQKSEYLKDYLCML